MVSSMTPDTKESCLAHLSRIEGQVRGVGRMVESDRYCIDIVTQIQAIKAALKRVEDDVLKDHVAHCVEGAIESGNAKEQRKKLSELLRVLGRLSD